VETEIGPLLDEYWYDAPETAKSARVKLLAGLV
jgi:5-methylcytosine-specific restriction enzyme B